MRVPPFVRLLFFKIGCISFFFFFSKFSFFQLVAVFLFVHTVLLFVHLRLIISSVACPRFVSSFPFFRHLCPCFLRKEKALTCCGGARQVCARAATLCRSCSSSSCAVGNATASADSMEKQSLRDESVKERRRRKKKKNWGEGGGADDDEKEKKKKKKRTKKKKKKGKQRRNRR